MTDFFMFGWNVPLKITFLFTVIMAVAFSIQVIFMKIFWWLFWVMNPCFSLCFREQKTTIALQPVEKLNAGQESLTEIKASKSDVNGQQLCSQDTEQGPNEAESELQVALSHSLKCLTNKFHFSPHSLHICV